MVSHLLLTLVLLHVAVTWTLAIRRGLKARHRLVETPAHDSLSTPVSILIPAWNEQGIIERCIRAVKEIVYPSWEAIILAGGQDGTYETAVQATAGDNRFEVLERGPEPKNAALARGVRIARNDVLVLLDADCVVACDWLNALVMPLVSGATVSLGHRFPTRETWVSMAEQVQNIQAYQIKGHRPIQGDRSVAFRRGALDRIGGMPPHTYAREDWDLGVRWAQAGEKIAFATGARLWAERPATLEEYWSNTVRWRKTHLAGSWEHRAYLGQNPMWVMNQFYFYVLSIALSSAMAASLALTILCPLARPTIGAATALIWFWILGRRAALGAEIVAFTGEKSWLVGTWSLVILLPVEILAALVAIFTVWCQPRFDYKGPRVGCTSLPIWDEEKSEEL